MNAKHLILTGILALTTFGSMAHAQVAANSSVPGLLNEYKYQVANLTSLEDAQALMDTETRDTSGSSICANRAETWTYMMNRLKGVQVGKVFIHFTSEGQADENGEWAYHVAPYVLVNGEEYVLDNGFEAFKHQPAKLKDWTKYFGKSESCVVLDPINNPKHLALEQNNMPNDNVTPLTYKKGGARQYPSTEGICYIRKVPMYYVYPIDVYGADLALAGKSEFATYMRSAFEQGEVVNACKQALSFFAKVKQSCNDYLGISK